LPVDAEEGEQKNWEIAAPEHGDSRRVYSPRQFEPDGLAGCDPLAKVSGSAPGRTRNRSR
jgi:hypothetical protein